MSVLTLTKAIFAAAIERHDPLVVDLRAPRRPPCQLFAPVFAAASATHPEVLFASVDTDPGLAGAVNIRRFPR